MESVVDQNDWTPTSTAMSENVAVSSWSSPGSHLLCTKIGPNHGCKGTGQSVGKVLGLLEAWCDTVVHQL